MLENENPNIASNIWDANAVYKVGDHYWIEGSCASTDISVVVEEVDELGRVRKGRGLYFSDYEDPNGKEFEVWDKRTRQAPGVETTPSTVQVESKLDF